MVFTAIKIPCCFQSLRDFIWNEWFWLPPGVKWDEVTSGYDPYRPLVYPIALALAFLHLRYFFEQYIFQPFGRWLGVKSKRTRKPKCAPLLEKAYLSKIVLDEENTLCYAKALNWTKRDVQVWFRLRRNEEKPTNMVKFCENSWRCLYYTFAFCYGVYVLSDKPWLWDLKRAWDDYPYQTVSFDVLMYYELSLSFYWSLVFSQFTDVRRKDFWQMFIHHFATIGLMSLSWASNLVRIGTVVLALHDCADIFLEAAKVAKYAKCPNLCLVMFVIFTGVWMVTRLFVYPTWIIYHNTFEAPSLIETFPSYWILYVLLYLLLVLHVFWSYLIMKIVSRSLKVKKVEGDIRSSSSDGGTDENNN